MTRLAIVAALLSASLSTSEPIDSRVKTLSLTVATGKEPGSAAAASELRRLGRSAVRDVVAVGAELEGDERGRLVKTFSSGWRDIYDALYEAGLEDQGYPMGGNENRMWHFAIEAAGASGPEATRRTVEIVARGKNDEANSFASRVLASQGREAEPALIPLLDSPSQDVRRLVAGLLGQDPGSADALLRIAAKPNDFARLPAIRGLTRLREPRVLPIAKHAIHASDDFVREAAAAAVARLLLPEESRAALAFLARGDSKISVRDTAAGFLRDSREPVSAGIGRRYDPVTTSPAARSYLDRRRGLFVVGSMALVGFVSFALNSLWRQGPMSRVVTSMTWMLAVLLVGIGWFWGRWVTAIYWLTEYEFAATAFVAVLVARARLARMSPLESDSVRYLWIRQLLFVFGGYFLGWMQLWGWSFEWIELFGLWRQSLDLAGGG